MEYIKVFNEHSDYETYINNDDKILPNLSYCKDVNDVHLNKVETRIIAKYNIEYSNYGVTLCSPATNVQEIEINGTKLESVNNGFYRFPKPGEYTVKFKLIDNTSIMNFYSTYGSLTDIIIPKSITYIPPSCF